MCEHGHTALKNKHKMDLIPSELFSEIVDNLTFIELKQVRAVSKKFYEEYSKRCNWFVKMRIQSGRIETINEPPYMSCVFGGMLVFFEVDFPDFLVTGKKLQKDGWYIHLENTTTGRHFKRKLVYDKDDGVLMAPRVYRNYRLALM
jgi:hypothetical protein